MDIIESIRRRPAMYIGCTTSEGIKHLIGELVANVVDLFLVNKANHVKLKMANNSISIEDNAPGLAIYCNDQCCNETSRFCWTYKVEATFASIF